MDNPIDQPIARFNQGFDSLGVKNLLVIEIIFLFEE
jgi:hypothetical protein